MFIYGLSPPPPSLTHVKPVKAGIFIFCLFGHFYSSFAYKKKKCGTQQANNMGWIVSSQNFYVEALIPRTSDCDYISR